MVEYVMNEIDVMQENNKLKKQKLNSIKNKVLKEMIYSNTDIPSGWTKKQDYN